MKYPAVRNAHVVPEFYLRNFAQATQIETHRVAVAESRIRSVGKVGVRRYAYRRTRPDGTKIDDTEWSLSQLEDKAAPLIRDLEAHWPFVSDDRAIVASFVSAQAVRGPRWTAWYEAWTHGYIGELRANPSRVELPAGREAQEVIDELEELLLSDTHRLRQMLEFTRKLPSAVASMHWTLVEFASPVIITSDHPLVLWPLDAGARAPQVTPPIGFMETLEIRLPISPRLVLLMTWADIENDNERKVRGARHHAKNINAFTREEAEQRCRLPGHYPAVRGRRPAPADLNRAASGLQSERR